MLAPAPIHSIVPLPATSGRRVRQPQHVVANSIMTHEPEPRTGSGEIRRAVTEHDGVQVDPILVDQPESSERVRQVRPGNFDLAVALGLELADRALEIT